MEEYATKLKASLQDSQLVPGSASPLIPQDFTPSTKVEVSFGSKGVDLGNFFRSGECKQPPSISFAAEQNGAQDRTYALILTDPDAPTPDDPKFAFWRHWVVADLKPGDGADKTAREPTAFLGPSPKDDSKPHRYLFLLYRAPENWSPEKADVGGEEFVERRSFKVAEFVEKQSLELVSVNWMLCAGDGWQG